MHPKTGDVIHGHHFASRSISFQQPCKAPIGPLAEAGTQYTCKDGQLTNPLLLNQHACSHSLHGMMKHRKETTTHHQMKTKPLWIFWP